MRRGCPICKSVSANHLHENKMAVLDNEIDLYKDKFKLRIGENEGLGFNGKPLITFKTSEVNTFDTTKFKMENPILYKQYLKQSNQRRLLVKEVKWKQ